MTSDEVKEKVKYYVNELKLLISKIASGYQPNPKIAEYIDYIVRWLSEHGGPPF